MTEYLFVYGTLLSKLNHAMNVTLQHHGKLLGPATCPGKLYRIAWYPGLMHSKYEKYIVKGELYQLHETENLFRILDEYEGINPLYPTEGEYKRVKRTVTFEGDTLESWVYLYQGVRKGLRLIRSGDFLADLDSHYE